MKVIIPVAGVGTRLRPHTYTTPKPLLYVAGKPVLEHVLQPILELRPEEVIFVVGYLGELIKRYVEDNFSFKARFIKQDELLGLGYAVNLALKDVNEGPVMVVLGDTIVRCNLKKFVASSDYVLGLMPVNDPHRFGIAEIENGAVTSLVEKPSRPKSNLAIIGLYYFKDVVRLKDPLASLVSSGKTTRGEIQLTDALEMMIRDGVRFVPFQVDEWLDCGKKETLLETNHRLLEEADYAPQLDNALVIPPVYISPSARVSRSVVGPYVSIARETIVDNCILKNSIIGEKTEVRDMVMEDSLIGNEVSIKGARRSLNIGNSSEIELP
ncbi:MAG: sugar phosphate nucleotidyltransferase [candidate division Zixibacteria bacterium]|nr:sugar phosphate nucleotidyltransferase [candidate division Zixibacteria bacterium]MDD5427579.1 sugar phosphate nucleotidyltransferase [candidate division Zixibacteria bacterium]